MEQEEDNAYPFKRAERNWREFWDREKIYEAKESGPGKNYYVLEMFPYTSARIHIGHVRNYSIGDVIARYMMMKGYNVLHPIGYDAFGLPAENAAIKEGIHPSDWTYKNVETIRGQLKLLGISYDWSRETITCDPEYYRWTQWLFLKFYERGLVYKKTDTVNWCSSCKTVLANEQVENERCWRCETAVTQKSMESWFFRITEYAQRLLDGMEVISQGWPSRVLEMQKNWIGRSEGVEIQFTIKNEKLKIWELPVFTTRADTIFGATYVVLSPEHPLVREMVKESASGAELNAFVEKVRKQKASEELGAEAEKEGVFTGFYAINPVNNDRIQVWLANYVLTEYGTGAIMAVPTHDQRDFEFARKYALPLRVVIQDPASSIQDPCSMKEAYEDDGVLVNSGKFDGLPNRQAIEKIALWMEEAGIGKRTVNFRIRDWSISRQRYWGEPIPVVYCDKCGTVPVPESELPVLLPRDVDFKSGGNPLSTSKEFVNAKCPKCGGKARRETDTMDCFVASSWYFLRYLSPGWDKGPFRKESAEQWMPVNQYIGGPEHSTKHLIYARFFTMVLKDMGMLGAGEPFERLLCQGMVIKDGSKMSKSKGNIVDPVEMIGRYGADVIRLFMLFAAPPDTDLEWSEDGIEGTSRFLNRIWRFVKQSTVDSRQSTEKEEDRNLTRKLHQTIKKVTEDIERFHFNTAIASMMEMVNAFGPNPPKEMLEKILLLLAPFAPHFSEECWSALGNKPSIFRAQWPGYDESLMKSDESLIVIQVDGKLRDRISVPSGAPEEDVRSLVLGREKVSRWLEGRSIAKFVFLRDKLVNIVTSR